METREKAEPLTLIQIDASVIVGVLILLSFTIGADKSPETIIVTGGQKSFVVSGVDIKPSSNEMELKPFVTALTASVVAQFAISAIFVALFSNQTIVRLLKFGPSAMAGADPLVYEENREIEEAKWGYKIGLLIVIPGFVTLVITMIVIGLTGSVVR